MALYQGWMDCLTAAEAARLRSQAAKERQIAKQVDLNLALQRLEVSLQLARGQL
jgi:hypothetical protein